MGKAIPDFEKVEKLWTNASYFNKENFAEPIKKSAIALKPSAATELLSSLGATRSHVRILSSRLLKTNSYKRVSQTLFFIFYSQIRKGL
tara:strand:+ start:248 stop:514 length:267 start_codon:yes stop_codon:yes gene_type:complete